MCPNWPDDRLKNHICGPQEGVHPRKCGRGSVKKSNINIFAILQDYMLIEFEDRQSVQNLLAGADHFSNADVPTQTRVLYLINPGLDHKATPTVPVQFDRMKGVRMTDLQNASSVSTAWFDFVKVPRKESMVFFVVRILRVFFGITIRAYLLDHPVLQPEITKFSKLKW
jgi:hypothetical protein